MRVIGTWAATASVSLKLPCWGTVYVVATVIFVRSARVSNALLVYAVVDRVCASLDSIKAAESTAAGIAVLAEFARL